MIIHLNQLKLTRKQKKKAEKNVLLDYFHVFIVHFCDNYRFSITKKSLLRKCNTEEEHTKRDRTKQTPSKKKKKQ